MDRIELALASRRYVVTGLTADEAVLSGLCARQSRDDEIADACAGRWSAAGHASSLIFAVVVAT
jgi:hypothetical protein